MLRKRMPVFLMSALLLTAGLFVNCSDDDNGNGNGATESIFQVLEDDSDLSTLVEAIEVAGLTATLNNNGSLTLFAPTNDAFDNLPAGLLDSLLADSVRLRNILLYHVAQGTLSASDIEDRETITTQQGEDIDVTVDNGNILLNETAQVTTPDIDANNGLVHKINEVLIPEGNGDTDEDEDEEEDEEEDETVE